MIRKLYVDSAHGQTHVRVAGDPQAPHAVLLLHPLAFDGDYFTTLLRQLDDAHFYVIPDYPGFGRSEPQPGSPSIPGFADACVDVMQFVAPDRKWTALGFHTGCLVAAELSLRDASPVEKNVFVDVPFFSVDQAARMIENMPVSDWPPTTAEAVAALFEKTVVARAEAFGAARAWDFFYASVSAQSNPTSGFHGAFDYPAEQVFAAVQQASFVLVTNSGLADGSRRAAAALPNAKLLELPDVKGHVFELFASEMAAAIASCIQDGSD